MASKKRTRGPNKKTPWTRGAGATCVLRLALDVGDPVQRFRLEAMFSAAYSLRRALQRAVRNRLRAYWASPLERERRGPTFVRERLGLSRTAVEHAAYEHLDVAPHLRLAVTKALAMHLANSVFAAAERNLFRDASGKTQGLLHVGRWFDFARLPGRARSHTTPRKWETFRLHGSLAGHRTAYTGNDGRFFQPRKLRTVAPPPGASWWSHTGPLVVVFSGLAGGDLALPVRLPSAPSNQPILDDLLGDADAWHKVDLVRRRDPHAPGGWRYEAHLMILKEAYVSPATKAQRIDAASAPPRTAGIDVNVSNVSIASRVGSDDLLVTRIERDAGERERERQRSRKERRRGRALDRSRRAANPEQYQLSKRQEERARRREAAGLPPVSVIPRGSRRSRSDGKPLQAYRKDSLSRRYKRERAAQAAAAAAASQGRKAHARRIAGALVLRHGFRAVVEDCNLTAWARLWGRAVSAFSPGTLLDAIGREALAVATLAGVSDGGVRRASTRTTALSQHCLCGARVEKALGQRIHSCATCGLRGDRDAVSAVLASCVRFTDETKPAAFVDFDAARSLLGKSTSEILLETLHHATPGRQDAPPESTAPSALDGSSVGETGRTSPSVMARQNAGTAPRATPNETGSLRTKSERAGTRTSLSKNGETRLTPLRDSS